MKKLFKTNSKYRPIGVTACGEVKNLAKNRTISQCVASSGYLCFNHPHLGTVNVHRMLAEVWIDNPLDKEQVNHIDGIKTHNTLTNLEWVTRSENALHAHRLGLLVFNGVCGEDSNLAIYTDLQVHNMCEDIQSGMRNVDVANKHNVPSAYIKTLKAGGLRADITSQYTFPEFKKRSVSESTVRWICNKIQEGLSNKEIVKLSSNPNVTPILLKNLKRKTSYKNISDEYF